jgi:hypothetical protein
MQKQAEREVEEWAYIFDTFLMDGLREVLYEASMELDAHDEDRFVVEFFENSDGYVAMDITDHVDSLEGVPTDENGLDEVEP